MMKYSSLEPRLLDMFRSPVDNQADHLQGKSFARNKLPFWFCNAMLSFLL